MSKGGARVLGAFADKRVLALDLGRRCGWCVFVPNGPERGKDSGVFELYSEAGQAYEDGERFLALESFLFNLDQACGGFNVVAFEQVNGGTKGRQTTLWNGYRAVVMAWCARTKKAVIPIPVHAIKTHVTGRGNATKEEVEAACVRMGYLPFDDNEADAIATVHTAVSLCDDRKEMERQLETATKMDLGEFKTVTVEKKKRKPKPPKISAPKTTKRRTGRLTLVRASSTTDDRHTSTEAIDGSQGLSEVPPRMLRADDRDNRAKERRLHRRKR